MKKKKEKEEEELYLTVEFEGNVYYVHNLVAEAWLNDGKPLPKGCWVRHKNGITIDNRVENLEIMNEDGSPYQLN